MSLVLCDLSPYVILDEKVAVMDTVDGRFGGEWLGNLEKELSGRTPDYLVVQHMEPDHSANIAVFAEKYPSAKIVASKQAFVMMKQFFGTDYADRQVVAAEKDTLELGKHTLNFIAAPMVHWPEVIMTYDSADKVLFTADGFGKFGALDAAADAEWDFRLRKKYPAPLYKWSGTYPGWLDQTPRRTGGTRQAKPLQSAPEDRNGIPELRPFPSYDRDEEYNACSAQGAEPKQGRSVKRLWRC